MGHLVVEVPSAIPGKLSLVSHLCHNHRSGRFGLLTARSNYLKLEYPSQAPLLLFPIQQTHTQTLQSIGDARVWASGQIEKEWGFGSQLPGSYGLWPPVDRVLLLAAFLLLLNDL